MSWISRIANVFRPAQTDADLEEELQFHIEQRMEELVRDGLRPVEAERTARRQLGNPLQLRETSHEIKTAAWAESLVRDCRFGMRMLGKYRTTSIAAILSLGLAIGACTTAFALMDALVFRPLSVPKPQELVSLARLMPAFLSADHLQHESDGFSYPHFELFRAAAHDEADLFAMRLSGQLQPAVFDDAGGASENIRADLISGAGFSILGIRTAAGRLIQADDDSLGDGHPVAVLSYAFWMRRFGASPAVIGRWVTIRDRQFQIIGVAAERFGGVQPGYLTDLWLPLSLAVDPRMLSDPDAGSVNIWGRLHPGIERADLLAPLQAVSTNYFRDRMRISPRRTLHGDEIRQFTDAPLHVRDASSGRDSLFRVQFRRPLFILALICGLLLVLACSNVANLMVARGSARAAELAVRISLGAGRSRLIQQMLVESGQLAAAACGTALLFASSVAPLLVAHLGSTEFPAWVEVRLDSRVVPFAAVVSLLTTILFGVLTALRASAISPAAIIKGAETRHVLHLRPLRWILAVQMAFTAAVLFLSGLLLLSFRQLNRVELGFDPTNVVLFDLAPRDSQQHQPDAGAGLLDHLRHLPGVQSASLSEQRPMGGDFVFIRVPIIRLPGGANEAVRPVELPVSPGFFDAMRIRRIAGRDFLSQEMTATSNAVIVNQAFAEHFFPGQDPVGRVFERIEDDGQPIRKQVVGVVASAHYNRLSEAEGPIAYTPLRDANRAVLNIRTRGNAASMIPSLRKETEATAPALAVRGSILLSSQIENTLVVERLLAMLAGFFSITALLLAFVGLYGVIRYTVLRRTREIGVRIAMGASRGSVVRLVLADSSMPILAGTALGIAGGVGLTRFLASQLFGVKPTEFGSLAVPLVCMLIAAAVALLPPSLRAAGADPAQTLRHE